MVQSLLKWKTLCPSSTSAPPSSTHRGTHTTLTHISTSLSRREHSVRQKASFRSNAARYHSLLFRLCSPSPGSKSGLQRPTILTISMRMMIVSKVQTGRKIRNQFQLILESSLRTSMIRKIREKIQDRSTRWIRDIFIYGGTEWGQFHPHLDRLRARTRTECSHYPPRCATTSASISAAGSRYFLVNLLVRQPVTPKQKQTHCAKKKMFYRTDQEFQPTRLKEQLFKCITVVCIKANTLNNRTATRSKQLASS